MSTTPSRIRNIGIMAHIDAGKTTVSERMLYFTGRIHRMGEVHEGEATLDWMEQERERGITITSAATTLDWRDHRIHLIDTPGHVDFTVEVERSLRILDGAVALFCAVGGVEPQSVTVWRQASKYQVPVIAFINKMDRIGADFPGVCSKIEEELGANAVPVVLPVGDGENFRGLIDLVENCEVVFEERDGHIHFEEVVLSKDLEEIARKGRANLIEKVSETDDSLMQKYLDGEEPSVEELRAALRRGTLDRTIVPVLCGSAARNIGMRRLLDAVVDYLPAPEVEEGPLSALAFKVVSNRHMKLVYVRVYSGTLQSGSYALNANRERRERIGRVLQMHANRSEQRQELRAGEIGALVGLSHTLTGDTLCDEDNPVKLDVIEFPAPVISVRIHPASRADEDKLSLALAKLAEEDPTFVVSVDPETGETLISGMGELHLDVLVDRIRREFKVACDIGVPQVAYRETAASETEIDHKLVKQTGGKGDFARVCMKLDPLPAGSGFEFINAVKGGNVPREYIPSVEKGVIAAMRKGAYAGYPVVDVRITLFDGDAHEVDSSERAFHNCAFEAFQKLFRNAAPILLEPVMEVDVVTPAEFLGGVNNDLSSRRGRIEGMDQKGTVHEIDAMVPLARMFGYATHLRTLTRGTATFSMSFDHYEPVPAELAEEILRKKKAQGSGL